MPVDDQPRSRANRPMANDRSVIAHETIDIDTRRVNVDGDR